MSLQIWLPFTDGTLSQQGLNGSSVTGTAFSSNDNGKLGKCIKTTSTSELDTNYSGNQVNIGDISFGGWFKFNKSDIESAILGKTYSSSSNYATGNVLGNNSYGGICLRWMSNDIYTDSALNSIKINSYLRSNNLGVIATSSYIIPFDTWTHIFTTYSRSTRRLRLWINGSTYSNVGHSADSPTDFRTNNLKINYKAIAGGNGVSANIPFYINDVRIYDHALSEKEVKELSKGLVLHYKLSGPGGENIVPNSNGLVPSGYRVSNFTTTTNVAVNEFGCSNAVRCTGSGGTSNIVALIGGNSLGPGESGVYYSYSIYVKNNHSTNKMRFVSNNSRVYSEYLNPGEAKRLIAENAIGNGTGLLQFNILTENVGDEFDFTVWHPKIEVGSKVTPWCPKSSDTEYSTMGYDDNIEYDLSGYKNNGTRTGTFTWTSDTPRYQVSSIHTGSNYIYLTPPSTEVQTIAVWVKWNTIPSGQSVILVDNGSGIGLGLMSTGILCSTSKAGDSYTFSKANLVANTWYHFVIVKTGTTTRKLYINGVEQTATSNVSNWTYSVNQLQLGKRSTTSDGFAGKLCDFRAYATALSAEDVKELYSVSASIDNIGNLYSAEVVEE